MIPVSAPFIDTALLTVTAWLITYLIHSTILLGAVWLLARFARPALALEDTLWKMALVGAMATALWQVAGFGASPFGHRLETAGEMRRMAALPAADVSWTRVEASIDPVRNSFETASPVWTEDTGAEAAPPSPSRRAAPRADRAGNETVVRVDPDVKSVRGRGLEGSLAARSPPEASAPTETFISDPRDAAWVPWLLLAVWGLGAGTGLLRLAWDRIRLGRLLRGRREITDGHLIGMLDRLRGAAGVRRRVRLSLSTRLSGPVALGQGEICLPCRVLIDLTPSQQQSVLAHELAHLERGDPGWLWVSAAVEAVFFFQPLNRLARRRLRNTAEFLCDDWAVRHAGGNLILARCLAEVAGWIQAKPALASGMAQRSSPLVQRIERLLEDRDLFREPRRGWRWLAGLALVAVVAAMAPGITTGSYERSDNAPWSAGRVPWPDYPFVLTPPGWTTTPLSVTTGGGALPLDRGEQLGAVYDFPARPVAPLPVFSPSPRARRLPPSPRDAIRIRRPVEHARSPHRAQARAEYDQAQALRDESRLHAERIHEIHARREALLYESRERAAEAQQRAREPERLAAADRAHSWADTGRDAWVRFSEPAPAMEPTTIVIEDFMTDVDLEPVPIEMLPAYPAAPNSNTFLTGEVEIPSEGLAAIVEQINEQLDRPLAIELGELAAALDLSSEDGVVELQVRLDQIKTNMASIQEHLRDQDERDSLRGFLLDKGKELDRVLHISEDARREVERGLRDSGLEDVLIFFGSEDDSTAGR